jgi:hypothetical protein
MIQTSRAYLVNPGGRKYEILPESSFNLKSQLLEPLKPFSSFSKSNHFLEFDSTMMKHRLMDVHETGPDPVCLSLGITQQYARKEEVLEFLLSRSEEELKEEGFDLSLLSELMGLDALRSSSQQPYAKPLLDLMVDANILFSSSRAELNDLVSTAAEFHRLRNSTRWRKLSRLVPQFQRFDSEVPIDTLQLPEDAVTLAPPKSPKKTRLKPSPKKQNPKIRDKEYDLYERNRLHACESLLSLMIGNEQHRKTTMLSLKKSRGELFELLTQCSIGFAGTGMAVLFFLVCNVASRQVPFCANQFFEGAMSLSLVLLSWSVSRLREALVNFNRKTINEEEVSNKVERRIKEVYFRAATVIAMVALRFG